MANLLEIIIKAKDQASTVFKKTDKSLVDMGKGLDGVNKLLGAFGLALGAREVFEFAKSAEEAARALKDAEGALTSVVGSTEAYEAAIAAVRAETKGTISETAAAQSIFGLLDNQIAGSAEEAARYVVAGQALNSALGDTASYEKFLMLLDEGSGMLLNNFNITASAVQARQAEIMATEQMSESEARLLAVRQLALEKGEELASTVSEETTAALKAQAAYDDMAATLGEVLAPAFQAGREAGADFFTDVTDGVLAMQALRSKALEVAAAISEATGIQVESSATWYDLAKNLNPVTSLLSNVAEAYRALGGDQAPIPGQTGAVGDAAVAAAADMREYASATNEAARAAGLLAVAQAQQAAAARGADSARLQGMANAYKTNPQLVAEKNALEEIRLAKVEADKEDERRAEQTAAATANAFRAAAPEIGSSLSSGISSAIDRIKQDLNPEQFPDLAEMLGGGATNVDGGENVRRVMALASGTILDNQEWATSFKAQNAGSKVMSGLFEALASGDQTAVQAEAAALIGSKSSVATIIADSIIQNTRAEMQQRDLMGEVNKIVAEAMGTGANAGGLDVVTIAAESANQAAAGVQTSFENTQAAVGTFGEESAARVNEVDAAILTLNGHLERTVGLFNLATANANGLADAGARAGVPNGAAAGTDQRAALGQSTQ